MVIKSSERQPLVRSRSKTLDILDKVINDLLAGNEKISISLVARTAGVTPGLIHNTYPAVAERIRIIMGKSVRIQRDSKHQELKIEKEKNRVLRAENNQLVEELARIASVNQRLLFEITKLEASCDRKVVTILHQTL